MLIEDGKGSGNKASVNALSQLKTEAVELTAFADASRRGDAFSWTAVTADINTGDTLLCVINQSRERKLRITKVYVWGDVPSLFKIHVPAAAAWAGTAVVGVCLNRKLSTTADAVAYADETGTTFADANVICTLHSNELTTDQFSCEWDFEGAVILGYDDAIAVDGIGETAAFNCSIFGYFED